MSNLDFASTGSHGLLLRSLGGLESNRMVITKEFTFDSAHRLPRLPEGHKCRALHGHTFTIAISVEGEVAEDTGIVLDFGDIAKAFEPILDQLDHKYLNEIDGLDNPTSENIARWIWTRLEPNLPGLHQIVVKETPNSGCSYKGGC